jgi:thymidylate synthase (FAD)
LNYQSFRYTEPEEDFYIPDQWRKQSTHNKQVSDFTEEWEPSMKFSGFNFTGHKEVSEGLDAFCKEAIETYYSMVNSGIGREMARMILPQNLYTTCYSNWDLNNLLKYLSLRDDSHAQWEIQQYAKAMKEITKYCFPWTIEAYDKYS